MEDLNYCIIFFPSLRLRNKGIVKYRGLSYGNWAICSTNTTYYLSNYVHITAERFRMECHMIFWVGNMYLRQKVTYKIHIEDGNCNVWRNGLFPKIEVTQVKYEENGVWSLSEKENSKLKSTYRVFFVLSVFRFYIRYLKGFSFYIFVPLKLYGSKRADVIHFFFCWWSSDPIFFLQKDCLL